MGTSSMGNSDTVAHQTMTDDTTVSDAMTDDTTVGNAMADTNDSSGESSSAIVSDFGDISVNVVGVVVDMLDPSVRKVDGVMSLPGSSAIVSLLGVKAGSRVVVSHGILVGVGGDLVGVDWDSVGHSMTNHGMANSVTDTDTMCKAMTNAHSVPKTNTMAKSSKQLGTGRGSSQEGGDRKESLRMKQVKSTAMPVICWYLHVEICCHYWCLTSRVESL